MTPKRIYTGRKRPDCDMGGAKGSKPRIKLSPTEQRIWGYILGYLADNGYCPTRQEIADALSDRTTKHSRQWAHYWLKSMAQKGVIRITKGQRGIEILGLE